MKKTAKMPKTGNRLWQIKNNMVAWGLLFPFLLALILIVWMPNIQGMIWSFFKMKGYTPVEFVGFKNYEIVLGNTDFLKTLGNTLKYVGFSIVVGYTIPIIVALLINELTHAKSFFKTAYYLPTMVPAIAVSMLWYYVYYPNSSGLLNMVLGVFGIDPVAWLEKPQLTILMIIISATWKGMGGSMLLYLAALQGINRGLYEAAVLDGASYLKRVQYITLPGISGVMLLNFVRNIISVFQIMEQPLTMTGGGPNNASMSLGLLAYRYAFQNVQIGNALAVNVIMFLILIGLTAFYFLIQKKIDESM